MKEKSQGYVLIATIVLGIAISIVMGIAVQSTINTSTTLNDQSYQEMADEAANAGVAVVKSCYNSGMYTWDNPLYPNTDCAGDIPVGSTKPDTLLSNTDEVETTFTVSTLRTADPTVVVVGTSYVLQGTTRVKTYTTSKVMTHTSNTVVTTLARSTGRVPTDIKNDETDCAIANGRLYCWGSDQYGMLGNNKKTQGFTNNDSGTPILVGGALAGKTVTKVSVGNHTVCAVADGKAYCWGDNSGGAAAGGALGNGTASGEVWQPTLHVPDDGPGSDIQGKKIVDIGTASENTPFFLWPFSTAEPHSCALTEDGAVACWGNNGFRQYSGDWYIALFRKQFNRQYTPTLIDAYQSNPKDQPPSSMYGKKAERLGVSSHDTCFLATGRMYCMGVEVPLPPICGNVLLPTGLFSQDYETLIPGNACIGSFSSGYDMSIKHHSLTNYTIDDKVIDPNTFEVSTNLGCYMASTEFSCVGNGPSIGGSGWLASFYSPWMEPTAATPPDVTNSDNGDNRASASTDGIYCIVNRGAIECEGQSWTGVGSNPLIGNPFTFKPINISNMKSGGVFKTPTKVAAGKQHGCTISNGQLFCWGNNVSGVLANCDNTSSNAYNRTYAAISGKCGAAAEKIGTDDGTYSASGPISTGGRHACAAINGTIYCWGANDKGQLSNGGTSTSDQPQAITFPMSYTSVTKISAGRDHTCAIVYAKAYCWGANDKGQLGRGTTTAYESLAKEVSMLANLRVVDISAGTNNTCAIGYGSDTTPPAKTVNYHTYNNAKVYCWGADDSGQIGRGSVSATPVTLPTAVGGGLSGNVPTSVSVGDDHVCAVANADLYCWGDNSYAQLGRGYKDGSVATTATPVRADKGTLSGGFAGPPSMTRLVSSVAAGKDFTCAIVTASVSCWGANSKGQLGRGTTTGYELTPAALSSPVGTYYATTITAGTAHACALINGNDSFTNGNMFCWGDNTYGQIGNGTAGSPVTSPAVTSGGDTVDTSLNERRSGTNISAGDYFNCAVANGVILCWGNGSNNRLGRSGDSSNYASPVLTSNYVGITSSGTPTLGIPY